MVPASRVTACGRYWRRTAECVPSAATSRSPVALLPSAKYAVTVPSSRCSYSTKVLSKCTTSVRPVNSTWRSTIRATECSVCTGSASGRSSNEAVWRSRWVTTLK